MKYEWLSRYFAHCVTELTGVKAVDKYIRRIRECIDWIPFLDKSMTEEFQKNLEIGMISRLLRFGVPVEFRIATLVFRHFPTVTVNILSRITVIEREQDIGESWRAKHPESPVFLTVIAKENAPQIAEITPPPIFQPFLDDLTQHVQTFPDKSRAKLELQSHGSVTIYKVTWKTFPPFILQGPTGLACIIGYIAENGSATIQQLEEWTKLTEPLIRAYLKLVMQKDFQLIVLKGDRVEFNQRFDPNNRRWRLLELPRNLDWDLKDLHNPNVCERVYGSLIVRFVKAKKKTNKQEILRNLKAELGCTVDEAIFNHVLYLLEGSGIQSPPAEKDPSILVYVR
jgi:hypothetical protein